MAKNIDIARPYQRSIIDNTGVAKGNVLIQLPTGGGKTFIALKIATGAKRVIFLAPKINLLEQTHDAFSSLNPQIIKRKEPYDKTSNTFISTIQTISRRPYLLKELEIDTIIIDEVHYGHSGNMQKIIRENHNGKIVGLSATPYDITGKRISGFDTVIDDYDINYLIDKRFLVPVEAICPFELNLNDIKVTGGDYNLKELDYKMSSRPMISAVVDSTIDILKNHKKTIVFCVTIEHCNILANAYKRKFKEIGKPKSIKVMHSLVDKTERASILKAFSGADLDIIVSVDMITTGFDAPVTDTIVLARPTKSQVLYKQIVGRGTRPHKKKEFCLLLDCGNVIEELGMPLAPIVEVVKKTKAEKKEDSFCPHCKKRKKIKIVSYDGDEELYQVCANCLKEIDIYSGLSIIKCPCCNFVHSRNTHRKNIIVNKRGIALKCRNCSEFSALTLYADDFSHFPTLEQLIKSDIKKYIKNNRIHIFHRECFEKMISSLVQKKEQFYTELIFTKNDTKALYLHISKAIKIKTLEKCVKETTVDQSADKQFIDFCNSFMSDYNFENDLYTMKKLYLEKNKEDMPFSVYKNVAIWVLKRVSRNKARSRFITICNSTYPYTDFLPVIIKLENLYKSKHGQLMPFDKYSELATWYLTKLSRV